MTIDTNTMVSITEAIDFSKAEADFVVKDEVVLSVSKKLIEQNKEAYEVLQNN